MTFRSFLLLMGMVLVGPVPCHGQTSIPIQNPSFELPVLTNGNSSGVDAPFVFGHNTLLTNSWLLSSGCLSPVSVGICGRAEIINPNSNPGNIDGSNIGLLRSNGLVGIASDGTATQDLGVSYTANTRYTLTVFAGIENIALVVSDYGFRLLDSGSPVPGAERNKASLLSILNDSNNLHQVSLTFDTGSIPPSGTIGVQFFESSLVGVGGAFMFDNVSLTAIGVPEPATIGLISLSITGGIGAFFYRRHRLKKNWEASLQTK